MPRKLDQLENAALALAQIRNLHTMRVGEIVSGLRLFAKQERELLSRMSRSGMIANIRKGLYLFPPRLPLGGIWKPDEATAIKRPDGGQERDPRASMPFLSRWFATGT